jgi:hypothetical protein
MRFLAGILFAAAAWPQQSNPIDPAAARPFQAYVTEAQGKVSMDRDNQPWAVSPGGTVSVQQVITTGSDGFARLEV